jgi:membrane-bound lytic murein transglycosylase F
MRAGGLWGITAGLALLGGCRAPPAAAPADAGGVGTATAAATSTVAAAPAAAPSAAPGPEVAHAGAAGRELGDLGRIRARGTLRVLVQRHEGAFLPRTGTPALEDVEQAERFAETLGVRPVFVVVEAHSELIPALLRGDGDLIAAQLSVTPARAAQIAFGRSTFGVSEILVGRKGAPDLPRSLEALKGRTVHVRRSSAYAETLERLKAEQHLDGLIIADAPETEDAEDLVFSVTTGERALTVVDSHILTAIESYNPRFERLLTLQDKREIAWAVRKESPELRAAMDDFFLQRALTSHRAAVFTGDLDGIRERKVLRVLTRNNPITYFLYRGRQYGFDYELAELLARSLGVRLEVVVPPSREALIPWLLEGKGDVVAAGLTVTEGRQGKVAFSRPYLYVNEVLVRRAGAAGPKSPAELAGRVVHVRRSSSYYETLQALQASGVAVRIEAADEGKETEELIQLVAAGTIELTVADDDILAVEQAYGAGVEAAFPLAPVPDGAEGAKAVAFALRPGATQLRAAVDAFVQKTYRGLEYNVAKKRYFRDSRSIRDFHQGRLQVTGQISPYDPIIKARAKQYGLDWRLMAAQAYVESRFDPKAKSWVGAQGLFQVMPKTGHSLGFEDLEDPEQGIHAGVEYMSTLVHRFDPKIPLKDRVRFALAGYNAGLGHVYDAQRLAKQKGWNPNRWFGHVEKAMLLLAEREYAQAARHGYCRGQEPVRYVSHIQSLYDAYVEVARP